MDKIVAILLVYWRERKGNIPIILGDLKRKKSRFKEIVVISNNPEIVIKDKDITSINCSRNFSFSIRHAMAILFENSHCLFIDDDLTIGDQTIENFIKWGKKYPESVLGYWGKVVKRGATDAYMGGINFQASGISKPKLVDTITGRIHFCKGIKAIQAFDLLRKMPNYPRGEDDILISLANRIAGCDNYVIPARGGELCKELEEMGVADWRRKGYWKIRDEAVNYILGSNKKNEAE